MAEPTQEKVDDLYFSVLSDDEEVFPISDEKYADGLQFQEVLLSSIISTSLPSHPQPSPLIAPLPLMSCTTTPTKSLKKTLVVGESSSTAATDTNESHQVCNICVDAMPSADIFRNPNCSHLFCNNCIGRYIGAKLQDNVTPVTCPEVTCEEVLGLDQCRDVVPKEVFERWENALCESMVLASQRFYCPFKDCSMLLVDDGEEVVTRAVCPGCQRLFCAQCKVAWHEGFQCRDYMNLDVNERGGDDLLLFDLAKNKRWKRCPMCRFYVERNEGCLHMTCRCKFQFCYGCGESWSATHDSCHT